LSSPTFNVGFFKWLILSPNIPCWNFGYKKDCRPTFNVDVAQHSMLEERRILGYRTVTAKMESWATKEITKDNVGRK